MNRLNTVHVLLKATDDEAAGAEAKLYRQSRKVLDQPNDEIFHISLCQKLPLIHN
ncbi:hypothetical protein [Stutzerimonas stutzeri]|uniref:hypothetical protein n=1 Tax=Stutzerimonas stutzeri TaxID=316 RepID=UPI001482ED46|nr:hypothetical protein [Stutzerimonas stutzeri]